MYLLTNERYITYQTGFSFGHLGHAQGLDLWYHGGVGGPKNFFFRNSTKFGVCFTYMYWDMHWHNFLGPHPLGPWGGPKIYISEHGHVAYQIKGDEQ